MPQSDISVTTDHISYQYVSDKDFLIAEYVVQQKSIKQIAREQKCAPSTVSGYLFEYDIPVRMAEVPGQQKGQTAFGQKIIKGKVVPHLGELGIIHKLQEMRDSGMTFKQLVDWLNQQGIKTKNQAAKWDRPTVYKILKRHKETVAR